MQAKPDLISYPVPRNNGGTYALYRELIFDLRTAGYVVREHSRMGKWPDVILTHDKRVAGHIDSTLRLSALLDREEGVHLSNFMANYRWNLEVLEEHSASNTQRKGVRR